jgi:hypothetical protein
MSTIPAVILGFAVATVLYLFMDPQQVIDYTVEFFQWLADMAQGWMASNPPGGNSTATMTSTGAPGNATA